MPISRLAARLCAGVPCAALLSSIACSSSAAQAGPNTCEPIARAIAEGRYDEAVELARRAFESGAPTAELARLAARALRFAGSIDAETLALADRSVALATAESGERSLALADALFDRGALRCVRGEPDLAAPDLERCIGLRAEVLGAPDSASAMALIYLAEACADLDAGQMRALEMLGRAAAIQAATLGADDPDVAFRWTREANLAHARGEDRSALELGQQAVAVFERRLRRGHPRTALAWHNLGAYHLELRDYPSASACLEVALELRRESGAPESRNLGRTQMLLAEVREALGDRSGARELWQAALDRLAGGAARRERAELTPRFYLARSWLADGDLDAADAELDRCSALLRELAWRDPADLAELGELAGHLRFARGDRAAAIGEWQRGLEALDPDDPDRAAWTVRLQRAQGQALVRSEEPGDRLRGVALLESALAADLRRLSPGHPDLAASFANLAQGCWVVGRHAAALEHALAAAAIGRAHLESCAERMTEADALGRSIAPTPGLSLALTLALDPGGERTVAAAWDALIRSRGLVYDEMRVRREIARCSEDPGLRDLAHDFGVARERAAVAALRRARSGPDAALEREWDEAREQRARAERALAERTAVGRAGNATDVQGYEDLATRLPTACALVAFARLDAEDRYVALVLERRGADPRAIDLGSARAIDELAARTRGAARRPGAEGAYRAVAAELSARILEPWWPLAAAAEEILLVPDGEICTVDFAALPAGDGRYRIDDAPPFHVLDTERDLAASAHPRGRGLLAMGGAAFDVSPTPELRAPSSSAAASPPEPGPRTRPTAAGEQISADLAARTRARPALATFAALPETRSEAETIAATWRAACPGEPLELLLDERATESEWRRRAPGRAVLHLATHGFVLDGDGVAGVGGAWRGLAVATEIPLRPIAPPAAATRRQGARGGLAFAGANVLSGSPDADGILSDEELSALDLSGVELAVLSACEGGAGDVQRGEGIFGLRRALRLAGARTVVASFWPVEDEGARHRIEGFFARWSSGGASVARALRDSERAALEARRARAQDTHPWHWAGFVAAGGR